MHRRRFLAALPAAGLAACSDAAPRPAASRGSSAPAASSPSASAASSAPSSASPSPEAAHAALLDGLDEHQLAGQLVHVGVNAGSALPRTAFTEARVGGLFLLGHWDSARAVREMLEQARATSGSTGGIGPLVSVDQEGGSIRMLRGDAVARTPSAEELGAQGPDAVREAYRTIGRDLSALGIGVDLAPVADVVEPRLGDRNAPVGELDRGFGTDPEAVAACVESAVGGLTEAGVVASLKHFPGLGRVRANTDHSAEGIIDPTTEPGDAAFAPFRRGIAAGARIVMVSSAIYPRIDPDAPAMFSRAVVTTELREGLGFEGLAITDDIGAAASVQDVPVGDRATRFLAAGGDAVLTAEADLAPRLVEAIAAWAAASPEQAAQVRRSAARVLAVKDALGLLP